MLHPLIKTVCQKLIELGLNTINISIESANKDNYKIYSGGDLNIVIDGIRDIIQKRKQLNKNTPSVCFSVTVMKDEIDKFGSTIELYKELEMDGGFEIQFLKQTDSYTKYYDDYMIEQLSNNCEMKLFIEKYGKEIETINNRKIKNYYDYLKSEKSIPK